MADHRTAPRTSARRTSGLPAVVAMLAATGVIALSCVATRGAGTAGAPSSSVSSTAAESVVPSGTASVPTSTPSTVDGLAVQTVSELLDTRKAGAAHGQIALRGYWSDRSVPHSCSAPDKPPGELELRCHDGEWGISEENEPIGELTVDGRFVPASSPHLTPFIPDELAAGLFDFELINGQRRRPVPIVVIGHLDDPRAKDCQPEQKQLCLDRFVIDRIIDYRPEAVPTPGVTPSPTPFPFGSPPPPPFEVAECAGAGPYSFVGWVAGADLGLDQSVPTTAYAAITKDVIEIGEWIDDPEGSGHQFRTMGRRICFAAEWDQGAMSFAWVPGTAYREWDDGRHTPLSP